MVTTVHTHTHTHLLPDNLVASNLFTLCMLYHFFRELRIACAQRNLPQDGTKPTLIDRLMKLAWQDRKKVERQRIMKELQDQREGEAAGAVYCFGLGYSAEYQSHDRPFVRNTHIIMTKLSGRGVHQVAAVRMKKEGGWQQRCTVPHTVAAPSSPGLGWYSVLCGV